MRRLLDAQDDDLVALGLRLVDPHLIAGLIPVLERLRSNRKVASYLRSAANSFLPPETRQGPALQGRLPELPEAEETSAEEEF